jgi:hypothetical protein
MTDQESEPLTDDEWEQLEREGKLPEPRDDPDEEPAEPWAKEP